MTTSHTIPPIAGEETMGTRERERWWESKGLVECLRDLSDQLEEMRGGKDDAALLREAAARLEGEEGRLNGYVHDGDLDALLSGKISDWILHVRDEPLDERDIPVALVRRREGENDE